ncbi:MAG: hypothetical protein VKL39_23960 [Leptolyngbyaceae bacterium]|nr:hypothetical protein [Leptolyngbyaceae bacterium]
MAATLSKWKNSQKGNSKFYGHSVCAMEDGIKMGCQTITKAQLEKLERRVRMDPNKTLHNLLISIAWHDYEEARQCLENLEQWVMNGGFPPINIRVNQDRSITVFKEQGEA